MSSTDILTVLVVFPDKPCVFAPVFNPIRCKPATFYAASSALFTSLVFPDQPFRFADASIMGDGNVFEAMRNTSKPFLLTDFGLKSSRWAVAPGTFYPADVLLAAVAFRKDLFPSRIVLRPESLGGERTRGLLTAGVLIVVVITRIERRLKVLAFHGFLLMLLRNVVRSRLMQLFATTAWTLFEFNLRNLKELAASGRVGVHTSTDYAASIACSLGVRVSDKRIPYPQIPSLFQHRSNAIVLGAEEDALILAYHSCSMRAQRMSEIFELHASTYTSVPTEQLPSFDEPRRRVYLTAKRRLQTAYFRPRFCPEPPKSFALRLDQIFVIVGVLVVSFAAIILFFTIESCYSVMMNRTHVFFFIAVTD